MFQKANFGSKKAFCSRFLDEKKLNLAIRDHITKNQNPAYLKWVEKNSICELKN